MSVWEIITSSLPALASSHPQLRRFVENGFVLKPELCRDDVVGLESPLQSLRVRLSNGEIRNA